MTLHPLLFNRLLVLVLLLSSLGGYYLAEDSVILRALALSLTLGGVFFLVVRRRISFPILLTLYLGIVGLTDWYFVSSAPLVVLVLSVTLLQLSLGSVLLMNEGVKPKYPVATYLIIALLSLEVLLLYSFYLISPSAIALLVLVYFYLVIGLTMLSEEQHLSLKTSTPYFGLLVLFTLLTLLSSGAVQ